MKTEIGDCYRKSAQLLLELSEDENIRLVHGSAWSEKLQRRINHAWVEVNETVLDAESGNVLSAERFYEIGEIAIHAVYTKMKAAVMLLKTRHFGPWESQILGILL